MLHMAYVPNMHCLQPLHHWFQTVSKELPGANTRHTGFNPLLPTALLSADVELLPQVPAAAQCYTQHIAHMKE
jgi:hypothetical protein